MKKILMSILVLCSGLPLLSGCDDDSFIPPPVETIYFQIVDRSGDPIPNAFVGVFNQFHGANIDSQNGSPNSAGIDCIEPEGDEPTLSSGELTSVGCTDENGVVKLQIDFTDGGINCDLTEILRYPNLGLFIKAQDGSIGTATETCDFIHDNTDAENPEHLQVYDLDF